MDVASILALVAKGVTVITALVEAKQPIETAVQAVQNIIAKGRGGTVTDQDLDQTEAVLDAQIDEFNLDLPA